MSMELAMPGSRRLCCQRLLPEPALEQPGGEQQRDEDDDAEQDAGKRDAELPDLDAKTGTEPVRISAPKAHCSMRNGRGSYDEREGERDLVSRVS